MKFLSGLMIGLMISVSIVSARAELIVSNNGVSLPLTGEGEKLQEVGEARQKASVGPINAVRVEKPPVIDGNLDDSCWSKAARVDRFVDIFKASADAVTEQTSALVAYDDQNLYIAVVCKESQMDKIKAETKTHDLKVYHDDCVEFFLQPVGRGTGDYYHFIVNSVGTMAEATFRSNMMNSAWNPEWQAAAKRGTDSWQVEIAIPFACLELTPETGSTWGFNIARSQVSKGELSAIYPTFAGFHVPAHYGDLTNLDVDFRDFCFSLRDLSFGKGKLGPNTASFTLTNSKGETSVVVANLRLTSENGKTELFSQQVMLGHNETKAVEIPYNLRQNGKYIAQTSVVDAKTNRTLLALSRETIVTPPPLVITVTEPNYDNCIYATQEVNRICADIDLSVDDDLLKSGRVLYALTDGKKTLEQGEVQLEGTDSVSVQLDASGLQTGSYALQAALQDKDGSVAAREECVVRKVDAFPGEVRIDEDNNLLVDGKPFFPIGFFQTQGAYELYPELKEAGVNMVQMYTVASESHEEHIQRQLDELHKNGIKLMLQMPQDVVFFWTGEERNAFLKRRIDKFGKHPALLAWYIADEPDTGNPYASPETLREVRDYIKHHDPYHPVTICILFAGRYAEYAMAPDILMGDPYPGWAEDGSRDSMEKISSSVDAGFAATKNRKPYWIIPSAFNESLYFPQNALERGPNYREVRCETYMAITHGVKGIIYYNLGSHPTDWNPEHPARWHGVKAVTKEMSKITPVLLADRSDKAVSINPEDKDIHFSLREVDGSYYLLAVNSSKEKKKVEFSLPWLESKSLEVISEDRSVSVTDGRFSDEFGKYEVHVYTTAENVPQLPTTKQIEAKCEQLDREFEESRKDNLAAAKDVIVEASSARRRATSAVDGIFGSAWVDATPGVYPDWWQIDFRAVKNITKIVIDSNLIDYDILAWDSGQWKTVEKVTGNSETNRVHEFADPIKTDKIRLFITAAGGTELTLNEVEFYQ